MSTTGCVQNRNLGRRQSPARHKGKMYLSALIHRSENDQKCPKWHTAHTKRGSQWTGIHILNVTAYNLGKILKFSHYARRGNTADGCPGGGVWLPSQSFKTPLALCHLYARFTSLRATLQGWVKHEINLHRFLLCLYITFEKQQPVLSARCPAAKSERRPVCRTHCPTIVQQYKSSMP